jgi:hypothetical protein
MISMALTLGAPDRVPAGKRPAAGPRHRIVFQIAVDVGNQVHDVGVALHHHQVGHLHRTGPGDPAQVVAPQVHQHQVFGPLLFVGQQFRGQRPVFLLAGPRGRVPAMGRKVATRFSRRTMVSGEEPTRAISSK